MFSTVSFEKLLEITAEDLAVIKNNLGEVYANAEVDPEVKLASLADAFNRIESWTSYFNKFKEIQDSKLDEISKENAQLKAENKILKQQLSSLKDASTETAVLKERIKYLEEIIKIKDNNSNLLPVDLVETLSKLDSINTNFESAIYAAQRDAAQKVYRQRVSSGEVTPAKRLDVDDEVIKADYLAGATPNSIAKRFGMTQPAIIYRLKKLGVYVDGGRRNK